MPEISLSLAQQCVQEFPQWLWLLLTPLLAPHLDAWIQQPAAGSLWRLVRFPLSLLGGNYGWARNAGQESLVEWWEINRQAFAAWLVKAAGEALRAELVKQASASVTVAPETPPAVVEQSDPAPAVAAGSQPALEGQPNA